MAAVVRTASAAPHRDWFDSPSQTDLGRKAFRMVKQRTSQWRLSGWDVKPRRRRWWFRWWPLFPALRTVVMNDGDDCSAHLYSEAFCSSSSCWISRLFRMEWLLLQLHTDLYMYLLPCVLVDTPTLKVPRPAGLRPCSRAAASVLRGCLSFCTFTMLDCELRKRKERNEKKEKPLSSLQKASRAVNCSQTFTWWCWSLSTLIPAIFHLDGKC